MIDEKNVMMDGLKKVEGGRRKKKEKEEKEEEIR